jgi:hypothetical protein
MRYAQANNKIATVGSDYHHIGHDNLCATRAAVLPDNEAELVKLLKSNNFIYEIAGKVVL